MPELVKIGVVKLKETSEFSKSYETAAWSKTLLCQPQTVDLMAQIEGNEVKRISWTYQGKVIDAYFPSLLGGVPVTDGRRPEEIGKEESVPCSPYPHSVAFRLLGEYSLAAEENNEITLLDNIEPLYIPYQYEGKGSYTASLVVNATEEQKEKSRGVAEALAKKPIPNNSQAAAFGWAMAYYKQADEKAREAVRLEHSAEHALHIYARDFVIKPEISPIDPELN